MLYDELNSPELNKLKHLNDSDDQYIKYEDKILKKNLSNYILRNNLMYNFVIYLELMVSKFFDNFNIVKNLKNFNVNKYYYKHKD